MTRSRFAVVFSIAAAATFFGGSAASAGVIIGGVDLGNLPDYLFVFTDASGDANWQGASKGFVGNVAIDGLAADERTSGTVPYAGTLYTNAANQGAWQGILNDNVGQASGVANQGSRITNLETDFANAMTTLRNLPATTGYTSVLSTSLNGLNTQNGIAERFVINVTSGLDVSSKITITGDASDVFILRWDENTSLAGFQGQTKFSSGGAIVPAGGLKPTNFINLAGDINASGGGTNPAGPYPQGPRLADGTGALISGGSDFSGGGFFTGYWLTTGAPTDGKTASLSNAIFVGGWYSSTTQFSMTSGTSGVYVSPPAGALSSNLGNFVWHDLNANGVQDAGEPGIPNVTVNLLDGAGNPTGLTTTTDANGLYLFANISTGTYRVQFVKPGGFASFSQTGAGTAATDSNGNTLTGITGTITLPAGTTDLTWDGGLFNPASLGNFVWLDENANGVQDGGEPGVAGVTVKLLDGAGNTLDTAITNASGLYLFSNLTPGSYQVEFVLPLGYEFTQRDGFVGVADDTVDSDAHVITGRTSLISLVSGQNDLTWDAGLQVPEPATLGVLGMAAAGLLLRRRR